MSTVHFFLVKGAKLTEEQKKRIREAKQRPRVYDPECPPLTREDFKRMERIPVNPEKDYTTLTICR